MILWKSAIQTALRKHGREIVPQPLASYLRTKEISVVIDVGASDGHYGKQLRALGYGGRIVSFEPLTSSFSLLEAHAKAKPPWTVLPLALGKKPGSATLNISSNGDSSSLLPMLDQHRKSAPTVMPCGSAPVEVATLDDIYWQHCSPSDRVFLKVDTQGFESDVLRGACRSLLHVAVIQIELSLVPLYDGQAPIEDLIRWLRDRDFSPVWFVHGFRDKQECRLLQIDGIFFRNQSDVITKGADR